MSTRTAQLKWRVSGAAPKAKKARFSSSASFDGSGDDDSHHSSASDTDHDDRASSPGTDQQHSALVEQPRDRWPMPERTHPPGQVVELDVPMPGLVALTAADQIVVRCLDGLSRVSRAQLIAAFNKVAELAAARAVSAERNRLERTFTAMGTQRGRALDVLAVRPPPPDLLPVLSPDVRSLDQAFQRAGMVVPAFKKVTVEVCGNSASFVVRDILDCMSVLIGSQACEPGETFLMGSSGRVPTMIREQVDGSNFRTAEASARASHPNHHFAGICLWVDATPVTNSMGTSVYPVWGWIANVVGSVRHKPGHSIVVAYLDTLKDVVISRQGFSSVPCEAASMVKLSLWDEMMWVLKRPLMGKDADLDRFGAPYTPRHDPGHPGRGGVLKGQRLPGKRSRQSAFKLDLIQVVCDVSGGPAPSSPSHAASTVQVQHPTSELSLLRISFVSLSGQRSLSVAAHQVKLGFGQRRSSGAHGASGSQSGRDRRP